ncbi:hypothetical protein LKO27_14020 [Tessaracoccus sp. OS52]|uniref:hypothetical protein n=1 Tax=Tessaracoccus sp. OS52 TaxID=2886691 RepID=UPI001D12AB88|nr:hypothetical protein [Tessaracoccus sp. OS52]MCC2594519.1 hypothetical protein [Tessaracoccus sp. OS52]
MSETHYLIKPRPPLRAYGIAAVGSLAGAVLLVLSLLNDWHWALLALGIVVLVAGIMLFVAGLAASGRNRVSITFNDDGYVLEGPRGRETGDWDLVTRVTQSDAGRHITIHEGPETRHHLVFAPGNDAQVADLLEDMTERLDAAKGYTNFA